MPDMLSLRANFTKICVAIRKIALSLKLKQVLKFCRIDKFIILTRLILLGIIEYLLYIVILSVATQRVARRSRSKKSINSVW